MRRWSLLLAVLAACTEAPLDPELDPGQADTPPEAAYGERCGNAADDDGDGAADEDCAPSLFGGLYAPLVSSDPVLPAVEGAIGRPVTVLQTYHSTSAAGIAKTGPDLRAIFERGAVAHFNVELFYTKAQLASPRAEPFAHDLAAMGDTISRALANHPGGRILLTLGAEMNGNWTPWGCLPPAQYIALYRAGYDAITAKLDARGIERRRVRWVWGPDSRGSGECAPAAAYYPGHAYVDLVGLSAYRSGTDSVAATVIEPMTALFDGLGYPEAWRRDRFVVLQTGTRDVPGRDGWIEALFETLRDDARAAGVIYFSSADWAVKPDGAGWDGLTAALGGAPVADRALEGTFAPHFWDVVYGDPGYAEIQALRDAGVTSGCATAPARFCPGELLDRRAAATLLARAFRLPAGTGAPAFGDVPASDPAFAAIQALAARGALPGCAADRFCPDEPVTERALADAITALGGTAPAATEATATRARGAVLLARGARLAPKRF